MKILIFLLFLLPFTIYSEIDVDKVIEDFSVVQNTGNAGREFWVSASPIHGFSSSPDSINFYIFSSVKTKVAFTVGSKQYSRSFEVEPNIVKLVRIDTNIVNPIKSDTAKIKDSDLYENSAVHIKSDYPIIVYVFIKRTRNSGGYLAIPTSFSSTKYINMTYYSSNYGGNILYPCYTSIISQNDNTNVKITLGGGDLAVDEIEFEDGRLIKTGESATQLMNRGDILLLSGNDNLHDISGSLIESDKPITILSGNSEVTIPINVGTNGSLTSMETPTYLWGENFYFTPMENRTTPSFFRAFAAEDSTKIYRNGEFIGLIRKSGGADYGVSYLEFDTWKNNNNVDLVTVTSDKPISLAYYNSHEPADGTRIPDNEAIMFQVPSAEQGVNSSLITVPYKDTEINYTFFLNTLVITFTLVDNNIPKDIIFDTFDSVGVLFNTVSLREQYEEKLKKFEGEYNGKVYGSINIGIERNRFYRVSSDKSKFTSYTYGRNDNKGYGVPNSVSLLDRSTNDNLAPVVYYEQDCNGNINSETAIVTDMPMDEENRSNLADIYMMAGENYEFDFQTPNDEFMPGMTQTVNWSLTITDNKKPASALLYAVDRAGNDTIIYIESQPSANLEMVSSKNEIRNPRFKTYIFQDTIKNPSSLQSLYITRVVLSGNNPKFNIESFEPDGWTPGIPIPPNQERYINYSYTDEEIKDNQTYTDSVYVGIGVNNGNEITECDFRSLSQVTVKTKYPEYSVLTNNDFGEFGNKPKITKLQDTIRNESTTRPLRISRIELKEGDQGFLISGYNPFDWKITDPIEPESEIIVDIVFNPLDFDRTNQDQILTDSLGIGVLEYNTVNELEEVIFNYKSEQKAVILAKDPETSIDDELILRDYITINQLSVDLLPKTTIDGFYELSIYDLVGNQLINIDTDNQKSISISNLHSGTYIITLKSEDRILTRKLIVVK